MSAKSKKKKDKSAGCGEPHSPWHGPGGEFVNPDKVRTGSWSCPDKGQTSRKGRSQRFTKVPCGRKAREQGKNVRCHDGKVMGERVMDMIRALVEEELLVAKNVRHVEGHEWQRLHIPTLVQEFESELKTGEHVALVEENCARCINNYIKALNAAIKASKGDLGDKK